MRTILITTLAVAVAGMIAASPASAANDAASTTSLQRGPSFSVNLSNGPLRGAGVDPVVFDSFTTAAGLTTTTGTPRTVMGGVVTTSGAGPEVDITAIDVYAASTATASYTNVRVNIQLWDIYTAAGVPVFSSPAGALITADLGPVQFTANTFSPVSLTLPVPVRLNSLANKGIAVSYQVDTGSGLAVTDAMTSLITYDGAVSVGTYVLNGGNGFFRNASNRPDYNFLSSDLRTFTGITDAAFGVILYGDATVPVTLQSFNVD
ncbi:MAG: hypothetical protein BGP25_12305 [Lysobacterales bacterium 63-13]|jgi:hypothetical protein|nr:MAG: hypothetical protein BGP25_12305 [Xanthomonadales bacterium 63-13]